MMPSAAANKNAQIALFTRKSSNFLTLSVYEAHAFRVLLYICRQKNSDYARNKFILRNHHLYVYSNLQPPHFHVKYNDYECWITIEDGIITGQLPRRAIRLVFEWLDLHKDELMANWKRLQNSEAPLRIIPLE